MSDSIRQQTTPPSAPLAIRAVLRTDVGRVRAENQDFAAMSTLEEEQHEGHPGGRLLIVADGMGGHRGGAAASRIATDTVKSQYLGSETQDVAAALTDAVMRANARVFAEAQSNPDLRGMGTTTSALVLRGAEGWFAHVGDSRIYHVHDGAIQQLTDDHSLVASMVREGLLTQAEAETHPRRNVLQRSLGVAEDLEIDVRGPFEIKEGDTFVLCSDGLHGLVKEDELRQIAEQPIPLAADEYIRRALERGAPDNVTVIVARVERELPAASERDPSLDDTQPDGDKALFDDTVRDVKRAELPAAEAGPAVEPGGAPPDAPPSAGKPLLKWTLLGVLALGAVGAWFYWIR